MTDYISPELEEMLKAVRKKAMTTSARLRVHVGERKYPILKLWDGGFTLDAEDAPHLRGLVDVYDSAKHLMECLIVASDEEEGLMHYEFKRATQAHETAPLDFAKDETAPVALLTNEPLH
jgi:hypothetical protein